MFTLFTLRVFMSLVCFYFHGIIFYRIAARYSAEKIYFCDFFQSPVQAALFLRIEIRAVLL